MPVYAIQPSFSGGELAPSLHARVDLAKYSVGLKTCRNFFVLAHGGVSNRPGTEFICETADSTKTTRLLPFEFNTEQTYVLEFGHQIMRVVKDGGQVIIPTANKPPAWATGTTYNAGDLVHDGSNPDNVYICIKNGSLGTMVTDTTEWYPLPELAGSTGWIIEIPTPYSDTELPQLKFTQSADVMTICHPTHAPRELTRTAHTSWSLLALTFGTTMSAPTGVSATVQNYDSAVDSTTYQYVVTSVDTSTGAESVASGSTSATNNNLSSTVTNTITWSPVSGADSYNVYKKKGGVYGFVGRADSASFKDDNIDADAADTPPTNRTIFDGTDKYPATVTYYQQRLAFAQSNNDPQTVWMSQTGNYKNFNVSEPLRDDDAVTFTIAARQVNEVRHMVPLSDLIVLTSGGEWLMVASDGKVVTPTSITLKPQGYRGISGVPPLTIGNTILYVQAKGSIIRDLAYALESDTYTGNDLTVLSNHLFAGKTVVEWAYAQSPYSLTWTILNDGTLAALTYLREHEVWGWSRHDTDGTFESVCSVAEGTEDATYFVVKRIINGTTKRYIERLHSRVFNTVADAFFVDSGLSYDGTHTGTTTMTLSGGTTWAHTEDLTLTASVATFVAGDVGNAIVLTIGSETLTCSIKSFTSTTEVTVRAGRDVPTAFQDVATGSWSKAVDELSGLSHLEGKTVSILADGNVEASQTVTSGAITISNPASKIHVGLPIQADLQTLDLEVGKSTVQGKAKTVATVTLRVEESRGGWLGPAEDNLTEFKQRAYENYGDPTALKTGDLRVTIPSQWSSTGSIFFRQDDPLPVTLLAVIPEVSVGR